LQHDPSEITLNGNFFDFAYRTPLPGALSLLKSDYIFRFCFTKKDHMAQEEDPTKPSHIDAQGQLRMVDVSNKASTARMARAQALLKCTPKTADALLQGQVKKGEAIAAARVAGTMAAKQTGTLIPLCHPLSLDFIRIDFAKADLGIRIYGEVKCTGRTGVEMEAMVAVAMAGLTLYDMGKSMEKEMVLSEVFLEEKTGGKSHSWKRDADIS
jgi:cyclic pyranopterin phosphate synthase